MNRSNSSDKMTGLHWGELIGWFKFSSKYQSFSNSNIAFLGSIYNTPWSGWNSKLLTRDKFLSIRSILYRGPSFGSLLAGVDSRGY